MKDKAFARAVKRGDIATGADLLGLSVEDHIANCLAAMQARAGDLGLWAPRRHQNLSSQINVYSVVAEFRRVGVSP